MTRSLSIVPRNLCSARKLERTVSVRFDEGWTWTCVLPQDNNILGVDCWTFGKLLWIIAFANQFRISLNVRAHTYSFINKPRVDRVYVMKSLNKAGEWEFHSLSSIHFNEISPRIKPTEKSKKKFNGENKNIASNLRLKLKLNMLKTKLNMLSICVYQSRTENFGIFNRNVCFWKAFMFHIYMYISMVVHI